jgi:hypothetical protein
MEIKDILSELIANANNLFNQNGQPENFDLEDFIHTLEDYYDELDELNEFYYEENEDTLYGYDPDEDDY